MRIPALNTKNNETSCAPSTTSIEASALGPRPRGWLQSPAHEDSLVPNFQVVCVRPRRPFPRIRLNTLNSEP